WPVIAGEMAAKLPQGAAPVRAAGSPSVVPAGQQGMLRRLKLASFRYDLPGPVAWSAPPDTRTRHEVRYDWVRETARHVGSVVHRWMQRRAADELRGWDATRVAASREAIRAQLAAQGVSDGELAAAGARVMGALDSALADSRGRWILGPQREAASEHRLTAVV